MIPAKDSTFSPLNAVSPVDGRYHKQTQMLSRYFSEGAIIWYRVHVEIEYFISLADAGIFELSDFEVNCRKMRAISLSFSEAEAVRIKEIEKKINHDVKAVEYFLREEFSKLGLGDYLEFIHFGLTSQDVNNTAFPMALRDSLKEVIIPFIEEVKQRIESYAWEWKEIPMLAHTHGQPASPTTVGKELYVFVERLDHQTEILKNIRHTGKFGGATGNLNAHYIAYPNTDWIKFANKFLASIGLERQQVTTQIEHYDSMAAIFDTLKRINTILVDFNRDMWTYISMEYFGQRVIRDEVGSSAMPHKVNPIDFENSEGNLGVANALLEHLSAKLPVSRLQRDLTDSTVTRNIGVPLAHSLIAYKSLLKGLDKIRLNEVKIREDLQNNYTVVAEAIQTILRREKYPDPYNVLKDLTRTGEKITEKTIHDFIHKLNVSQEVKNELMAITPFSYTGRVAF